MGTEVKSVNVGYNTSHHIINGLQQPHSWL